MTEAERRMNETAGERMHQTGDYGMALVERIVAQGRQPWRGEEEVVSERRRLGAVGMITSLLGRESHRCCQG
jgi:hypothetical protein